MIVYFSIKPCPPRAENKEVPDLMTSTVETKRAKGDRKMLTCRIPADLMRMLNGVSAETSLPKTRLVEAALRQFLENPAFAEAAEKLSLVLESA